TLQTRTPRAPPLCKTARPTPTGPAVTGDARRVRAAPLVRGAPAAARPPARRPPRCPRHPASAARHPHAPAVARPRAHPLQSPHAPRARPPRVGRGAPAAGRLRVRDTPPPPPSSMPRAPRPGRSRPNRPLRAGAPPPPRRPRRGRRPARFPVATSVRHLPGGHLPAPPASFRRLGGLAPPTARRGTLASRPPCAPPRR
ncbi:hypothetical protein BU14_0103s0041, partial [Porphyra umbilicalis]